MSERLLYEFPHSHFCEKARWALDYKGLPFRRVSLLPPWHALTTRKFGKKSSVPVLVDGARAVQGSSEIISYLDEKYGEHLLAPAGMESSVALAREKTFDRQLGVPLRAFFYHYTLKYRVFVSAAFLQNSPAWQKPLFRVQYPIVAALIRRGYCPDEKSAEKAGATIEQTLDALARDLGAGQELKNRYLAGDKFSRLDLTVSALLSFIALPPELPVVWPELPKDDFVVGWHRKLSAHPVCDWVRQMYREHRQLLQNGVSRA